MEVPTLRTVVRLADRDDPLERVNLLDHFVLTGESRRILAAVARRITERTGGGVFIVGGYGSGKSHLLTVLSDLDQTRAAPLLRGAGIAALPQATLTVPISLVSQPAQRTLHAIVVEALSRAIGDFGTAADPDVGRDTLLQVIRSRLGQAGYSGVLILLDELSEFLRAKADRPALREEVRFLQFLGEHGAEVPLTLVATLQESLETAAEVAPDTAGRLRDRYLTLPLTGAHLAEVVTGRLLHRPPNAQAGIAAVRSRLTAALGRLPSDAAAFDSLYPIYPPVLSHLDALRHHLSATRGAIDFLYSHLVGDLDRGITGILDEPADTLILPDALIDHFDLRLRESAETAPLMERVYDFYMAEGSRILGEDTALGLRVVRDLVLEAAGAHPRPRTAADIALDLALAESQVDPDLGKDLAEAALSRMVAAGAYVRIEPGPDGPRYAIDLEADAGLMVRLRVERQLADLRSDDERVFAQAYASAGDFPIPLRTFHEDREIHESVNWQRTPRDGVVWFGDTLALREDDLRAWLDEIDQGTLDFVLVIAAPKGAEPTERLPDQTLFPALASLGNKMTGERLAAAIAVWAPAPAAPMPDLRRHLALTLVERSLAAEATDTARRQHEIVSGLLLESAAEVRKALADAYLRGYVLLGNGDTLGAPAALGARTFQEILERICAQALEARHPRHLEIMPTREWPTRDALDAAVHQFLTVGEAAVGDDSTVDGLIQGFFIPLGLAERHGRAYRLKADPKRSAPLAVLVSDLAAAPTLESALRELRTGPFGLDDVSARLVVLTALFGGLASGRAGGRKVPLRHIARFEDLDRLEELTQGGETATRLPAVFTQLAFLHADPEAPYLATQQRELWARACHWKGQSPDFSADLSSLEELTSHPALSRWAFEPVRDAFKVAADIAQAIHPSLGGADGLSRLAQEAERKLEHTSGELKAALSLADEAHAFLTDGLSQVLLAYRYLCHPAVAALAETAAELSAEGQHVMGALTQGPGLWWTDLREKALGQFAAFAHRYAERYVLAHRRAVGESVSSAIAALDRQYGRAMAGTGFAPDAPEAPWAKPRRNAQTRHCELVLGRTLEVEPTCSCGYRLGDPPLSMDLAGYRDILATLPAGPATDTKQTPVTPAVPKRSIASLVASLAGRTVTGAEARQIFETWLAGGSAPLAGPSVIRIEHLDGKSPGK